jgi:SAM-dependent methyltransferase
VTDRASLSSTGYAVRRPLRRWLAEEARLAGGREPRPRVLDVGCGVRPYEHLFTPHVSEYVGVDVANPAADLEGSVEEVPVPDGSFDLVLCTQTLEHALDPARAVHELRRVVAPGGRVLASTHGVQVYHPNPVDLWRWTHAGLERLFRENGAWSSLTVSPGAGTGACLGMLIAHYADLLAKRAHIRPLGLPFVVAANLSGRGLDAMLPGLRQPQPGTIFANFHVVAEP